MSSRHEHVVNFPSIHKTKLYIFIISVFIRYRKKKKKNRSPTGLRPSISPSLSLPFKTRSVQRAYVLNERRNILVRKTPRRLYRATRRRRINNNIARARACNARFPRRNAKKKKTKEKKNLIARTFFYYYYYCYRCYASIGFSGFCFFLFLTLSF